jgi:uncharacterized protein (TIGR02271 family)
MKNNKDFVPVSGEDNTEFNQRENDSSLHNESSEEKVIPVIEETLHVDKKWVETGKVNISKKVTEHEETIDVPLSHEEVNIERVEVNKYIETLPPPVRYEGETMIIPVLREVVVKRVLLVEELRVTKKDVQTQEKKLVTLKKDIISE